MGTPVAENRKSGENKDTELTVTNGSCDKWSTSAAELVSALLENILC